MLKKPSPPSSSLIIGRKDAFTLVELIIAMLLTSFVSAAIYVSFLGQQKSYTVQDQVVEMQQNIRAAMAIMAREIMLAGYDPENTGDFGITSISSGKLTFTIDKNDNGILDGDESIQYALYDAPLAPVSEQDGISDLGRDEGSGADLVAESICALAFAYAFDNDADGVLDTVNSQIVWAIDSDNDGRLDTSLDTSGPTDPSSPDGLIDSADTAGGISLGFTVPKSSIRAVKVWVLAESTSSNDGFVDSKTYIVGPSHLQPNDAHRHRLLTSTIFCRNT